ncbi:phosphopantetheine-binding protein, partial [Pseudomonas farsensis]
ARLMEQPQVREAVVLAVELAGSLQLVGYVVPVEQGAGEPALRDTLKAQLSASLPDYMVPSHWVWLAQMPLSPNGKLERRALPAPEAAAARGTYRAPVSDVQIRLAAIWQEVLQVERVGLDDDFFELGGHSLQLVMVQSRLRSQLGIDVPLKDFHSLRQLHALAKHAGELSGMQDSGLELDLIFGALDELEEHNA